MLNIFKNNLSLTIDRDLGFWELGIYFHSQSQVGDSVVLGTTPFYVGVVRVAATQPR